LTFNESSIMQGEPAQQLMNTL